MMINEEAWNKKRSTVSSELKLTKAKSTTSRNSNETSRIKNGYKKLILKSKSKNAKPSRNEPIVFSPKILQFKSNRALAD